MVLQLAAVSLLAYIHAYLNFNKQLRSSDLSNIALGDAVNNITGIKRRVLGGSARFYCSQITIALCICE